MHILCILIVCLYHHIMYTYSMFVPSILYIYNIYYIYIICNISYINEMYN